MTLFVLGSIDPLLVGSFGGFDRPGFVQRVRLLSDGVTPGPDEILQGSGVPFETATITGVLQEAADLAALRGYDLSKEAINFTDGNGNVTAVRVLELTTDDFTQWWAFSATLIAVGDVPGS